MEKVDIYLLNISCLDDKKIFEKYYFNMPLWRKQKIDTFIYDENKKQSLGAGILLAIACKDNNILGKENNIAFNSNGKPYFINAPYFFNISQSNDYVALAFSKIEVGCDIEKIDKVKNVNRIFTDSEIVFLNSQEDKLFTFYRLWTLKESYIKLSGKNLGMARDKSIEFDCNTAQILGENIIFFEKEFDGYYLSVCTKKKSNCTLKKVTL